jgi:hypothetical protein
VEKPALRSRRGRARRPDPLPLQEAPGFLGLPAIPFAYDGLQALDGGLIHAGERDLGADLGTLDRCGFGTRGLD